MSNIDYESLSTVQSQEDFDALDDDHKQALKAVASRDSDAYLEASAGVSDTPDEQG